MYFRIRIILSGAALLAGTAQAAGFALAEQNASGLGNAYAGQAAVAEDASTVFFNPAGLTQLDGRQVVLAGHLIMPSAKLSNAVGTPASGLGDGGNAGKTMLVPNAYFAADLGTSLKLGVGLNSPFGLSTEYDTPWLGQTQAIKSRLNTVNLNPALAWWANDRLSLGFGVDWQYLNGELSQSLAAPGLTQVTMKGHDDSWGWNLGALWQMDPDTRLGLTYRSRIDHKLKGSLSTGVAASADISVPDSASLSVLRHLDPRWDLLADLTWTGWSSFDQLAVAGSGAPSIPENWKNTERLSLGLTYRPVREWTWRMGVAYDPTPVPDASHRTPRIPDGDRTWLAMGGQYRMGLREAVDFGYAHLFVRDATIDHSEGGVTLAGTYNDRIDIVSVQYTRGF